MRNRSTRSWSSRSFQSSSADADSERDGTDARAATAGRCAAGRSPSGACRTDSGACRSKSVFPKMPESSPVVLSGGLGTVGPFYRAVRPAGTFPPTCHSRFFLLLLFAMRKWLILLVVFLSLHAGGALLSLPCPWAQHRQSDAEVSASCGDVVSRCEVCVDRRQQLELLTESASNPAYTEPTNPLACHVQRLSEASPEHSLFRYTDVIIREYRASMQRSRDFSSVVSLCAGQPVERYVLRLRRLLI